MGMFQFKLPNRMNKKTRSSFIVTQYSWCPWKNWLFLFTRTKKKKKRYIDTSSVHSINFCTFLQVFFTSLLSIRKKNTNKNYILKFEGIMNGDFFCLIATFRVVTLPFTQVSVTWYILCSWLSSAFEPSFKSAGVRRFSKLQRTFAFTCTCNVQYTPFADVII